MRRIVIVAALGLCLAACSSGVTFQGQLNGETVTGTMTGSFAGADVTITNGKDLACSGPVSFTAAGRGTVTLHCTNGQTGTSTFVSDAGTGTASGTIGGKPFSASFKAS